MPGHGDEGKLVAALVAGRPLAEIAASAGVSVSTVQRRVRDPEIALAVEEARRDSRRAALARVLRLRDSALTRVGELLLAEDAALALRAAALILTSAVKAEADYDFRDRLTALEAALNAEDRRGGDGEVNDRDGAALSREHPVESEPRQGDHRDDT